MAQKKAAAFLTLVHPEVVIVSCGTAPPEYVCTSDDSVVNSYKLVADDDVADYVSTNTFTIKTGTEIKANGRYKVPGDHPRSGVAFRKSRKSFRKSVASHITSPLQENALQRR